MSDPPTLSPPASSPSTISQFKKIILLVKLTRWDVVCAEVHDPTEIEGLKTQFPGMWETYLTHTTSIAHLVSLLRDKYKTDLTIIKAQDVHRLSLANVDAIISAGGDGTFLEAATLVGPELQLVQNSNSSITEPNFSQEDQFDDGSDWMNRTWLESRRPGIAVFGINTDPTRSEGRLLMKTPMTSTPPLKPLTGYSNGNEVTATAGIQSSNTPSTTSFPVNTGNCTLSSSMVVCNEVKEIAIGESGIVKTRSSTVDRLATLPEASCECQADCHDGDFTKESEVCQFNETIHQESTKTSPPPSKCSNVHDFLSQRSINIHDLNKVRRKSERDGGGLRILQDRFKNNRKQAVDVNSNSSSQSPLDLVDFKHDKRSNDDNVSGAADIKSNNVSAGKEPTWASNSSAEDNNGFGGPKTAYNLNNVAGISNKNNNYIISDSNHSSPYGKTSSTGSKVSRRSPSNASPTRFSPASVRSPAHKGPPLSLHSDDAPSFSSRDATEEDDDLENEGGHGSLRGKHPKLPDKSSSFSSNSNRERNISSSPSSVSSPSPQSSSSSSHNSLPTQGTLLGEPAMPLLNDRSDCDIQKSENHAVTAQRNEIELRNNKLSGKTEFGKVGSLSSRLNHGIEEVEREMKYDDKAEEKQFKEGSKECGIKEREIRTQTPVSEGHSDELNKSHGQDKLINGEGNTTTDSESPRKRVEDRLNKVDDIQSVVVRMDMTSATNVDTTAPYNRSATVAIAGESTFVDPTRLANVSSLYSQDEAMHSSMKFGALSNANIITSGSTTAAYYNTGKGNNSPSNKRRATLREHQNIIDITSAVDRIMGGNFTPVQRCRIRVSVEEADEAAIAHPPPDYRRTKSSSTVIRRGNSIKSTNPSSQKSNTMGASGIFAMSDLSHVVDGGGVPRSGSTIKGDGNPFSFHPDSTPPALSPKTSTTYPPLLKSNSFFDPLSKARVLYYRPVNDVLVSSRDSYIAMYAEISIDGGPPLRTKNSGVIICTGSGSSAWAYNVSKITEGTVDTVLDRFMELQPAALKESFIRPDASALAERVNASILFDPCEKRLRYVIREPIQNRVFATKESSGFCQRISVRPLTNDVCISLDGLCVEPLLFGETLLLEIGYEEDVLLTGR